MQETVDASNPFWLLDRTRCILCQRCVDACQHVQHIDAIALLDRSLGRDRGLPPRSGDRLQLHELRSVLGDLPHARYPAEDAANREPDPTLIPVPGAANGPCDALGSRGEWCPRGDDLPAITRRVETTCPYCGVGCGLVLNLATRGSSFRSTTYRRTNRARECSVSGRFGLGFMHSPDRLTTPLVRRERGGPLESVSWDEALDLVAARLALHRTSFAALGSAKATNEDGYVLQKLARAVMGTNNVDHCSRLCHSASVVAMLEMLGSSATSNSYADFEQAGCLLVAGSDTDANHPVIAARVRKAVAEHGTALIVVNPRRIGLCDIADIWLRPRPGTDVALFNGMARIALDEGLWDEDFVQERTEGYDAWRTSLAPYGADTVAAITGVDAPELRQAARLFARPGAAVRASCGGWGSRSTREASPMFARSSISPLSPDRLASPAADSPRCAVRTTSRVAVTSAFSLTNCQAIKA